MSALRDHLPQLQAVLFDMDGTLIDTDDQMVDNLARRLQPMLQDRSRPLARWLMTRAEGPGNGLIRLLDLMGLEQTMVGVTDWLHQRRGLRPTGHFQLIDGMDAVLPELHGRFKLALVTTRSHFHINAFYNQFHQLAPLFTTACGIQDTRRLKPDPAPVRLAAERLNVRPENCVMVGDTAVDMLSARRAGAWAIGVLCGFGERAELEDAGAHLVLNSTAEVGTFLRNQ